MCFDLLLHSPSKRVTGRGGESRAAVHLEVPVWVGCGQHELELHNAGVVLQLTVLDAVEFISDVSSTNIHLRKESRNHVRHLIKTKRNSFLDI